MAAKKPPTRIQKAGSGHRYFLDGAPVSGVTTILSNGFPKPALQGWAANTTADFVMNALVPRDDGTVDATDLVKQLRKVNAESRYPKQWAAAEAFPRVVMSQILAGVRFRDRDQAAGKGSSVHGFAERLARGEEVTPPAELADHVSSYVDFLNDWEPSNAVLERVVVNRRFRYMGKFDLFAEFPGKVWASGPWEGQPVGWGLLDVKTSRSGIFPDVALQLAGYAGAETMLDGDTEVPMPKADWCGAIHVRADGYDVVPFNFNPADLNDPTFRTFLYCKQVADWSADDGLGAEVRHDIADVPVKS